MSQSTEGHRSDEITSYLSETLEPEERAAFEEHLKTCEECQRDLAAQKALFAQVNKMLAVKPKRTIEEQVARFEKMVAEERAGKTAETRRRRVPGWAIGIGAAVATAAAAAVGILETAGPRLEPLMNAPRPQVVDAGKGACDGGEGPDAGCGEATR